VTNDYRNRTRGHLKFRVLRLRDVLMVIPYPRNIIMIGFLKR